ncbi:hypothetical protein HP393_23205, partial [Clostridioides difficile]|nr:hypothetical protein [Clostridioides difficile]
MEALKSVKEKLRVDTQEEKVELTSVGIVDKGIPGNMEDINADLWNRYNKFKEYYYLLHRWMQLKEDNINI